MFGYWLVVLSVLGCTSSPSSPNPSSDCIAPDDPGGDPGSPQARPDPPRQTQSAPSCTPQPFCPHKGGNAFSVAHNRCADRSGNVSWDWRLLPNDQLPDLRDPPDGRAGLGCDVNLDGRYYDAMSWDWKQQHRHLWEVSTRDWSNYYKYNNTLRPCTKGLLLDKFVDDCLQVLACNKGISAEEDKLTLVWGFSDEGLYWAVVDYFANADNYEREILSQARALGLPDDPGIYCTIENLQRCR